MTMKMFVTLVFVAMATMTSRLDAAGLVAKPDKADDSDYAPLDMSHIDPVDLCLFVCHSCFQQVSFNLTSSSKNIWLVLTLREIFLSAVAVLALQNLGVQWSKAHCELSNRFRLQV